MTCCLCVQSVCFQSTCAHSPPAAQAPPMCGPNLSKSHRAGAGGRVQGTMRICFYKADSVACVSSDSASPISLFPSAGLSCFICIPSFLGFLLLLLFLFSFLSSLVTCCFPSSLLLTFLLLKKLFGFFFTKRKSKLSF